MKIHTPKEISDAIAAKLFEGVAARQGMTVPTLELVQDELAHHVAAGITIFIEEFHAAAMEAAKAKAEDKRIITA